MHDQPARPPATYLFSVRLWSEDMGAGHRVVRGEVRYVLTGGICYFQDWSVLVAYLENKLLELEEQRMGGGTPCTDEM